MRLVSLNADLHCRICSADMPIAVKVFGDLQMNRWFIFAMVTGGLYGALTFLRIVGHEIAITNRDIDENAKIAREALKKRREAEEHERKEDALMAKRAEKQSANGAPKSAVRPPSQ